MPLVLPTPENLQSAAAVLQAGGLVATPTETVYGLAAAATNPHAVLKIYEAKVRPRFNPLIVHVTDLAAAQQYGVFSQQALQLAAACWPGPLTLVVPLRAGCLPEIVTAGLPTVALRVPAHPVARALLAQAALPLAAPSANRSGHVSATTAAHVQTDFGPELLILDGGPCPQGLESTVVECTSASPHLLRPGSLPRKRLEALLGRPLEAAGGTIKAPGMLASHYAPKAKIRLNVTELETGEALLAFGPHLPASVAGAVAVANLSPTADLQEAAINLFAMLRELDGYGANQIAVLPIPSDGLGEALNDRLQRAAAPRG